MECNDCDIKTTEIRRLHRVCKAIRLNALQNIYEFTRNVNPEIFIKIFGTAAPHLWLKFSKHFKHDLLSFYKSLDTDNTDKLNHYMNTIL